MQRVCRSSEYQTFKEKQCPHACDVDLHIRNMRTEAVALYRLWLDKFHVLVGLLIYCMMFGLEPCYQLHNEF